MHQTIHNTERELLETLLLGLVEKLSNFEITFWEKLIEVEENVSDFDEILAWWVKLVRFLDKEEKTLQQRKKKKLRKLLKDDPGKLQSVLKRYEDHLECFEFKKSLEGHGKTLYPDMDNLLNLIDISSPSQDSFQI